MPAKGCCAWWRHEVRAVSSDRLVKTRDALASVHSLRVARARRDHQAALHSLQIAQRTHDNTRTDVLRARAALELSQRELTGLGTRGVCRAEELLRVVTRLSHQRDEEKMLTRRIDIARKAVERADAEVQRAAAALHRALHAQEHTDEVIELRIGAQRAATERRCDERVVDELAVRRRTRP